MAVPLDPPPAVLAFDVFGTVVDWHGSIAREVGALELGIDPGQFALAWRAGYHPAMARVRSGELGWTKIDDLHRMILDQVLDRFGIADLSEAQKRHLNLAWHRLDPWPDVAEGLTRLRRRFTVCSLSNGNLGLQADLFKYGGLQWDLILSAEVFRHYKPDPETYLGVCDVFDIAPAQMMLVAAHHADLAGARACGCRSAYIERPLEFGPAAAKDVTPRPDNDLHATDLLDLARQLGC
ncbi:MAG: haloacid dehalogenase type II [Burkholderiales bacterium]|nr:haloacid dehalogenase type II [Burkholderiales bacterium]ODU67696.1 MAG: haloacid dehalogenase, type II [Lautropia sp. SCN 66-9]